MKPKSTSNELNQNELFWNGLDQILNSKRPLYQISKKTDWEKFEKAFVQYYTEKKEHPGSLLGMPRYVLCGHNQGPRKDLPTDLYRVPILKWRWQNFTTGRRCYSSLHRACPKILRPNVGFMLTLTVLYFIGISSSCRYVKR